MRQRLVVGNWKMHGTGASVKALTGGVVEGLSPSQGDTPDGVRVVLCPSLVHLAIVWTEIRLGERWWRKPGQAPLSIEERQDILQQRLGSELPGPIYLGAQDVSTEAEDGARTGEVSAAMLEDLGITYVIVGHSERRQLLGETDAVVAAKFKAAQSKGLTPILCLGETLAQREQGYTAKVVLSQLQAVIEAAGIAALRKAVIAYEPVWAIGTGVTATPEQAQEVHAQIRAMLCEQDAETGQQLPILYGGSVKAANAAELFNQSDIDGGLVGGASLQAEEFVNICRSAKASPN